MKPRTTCNYNLKWPFFVFWGGGRSSMWICTWMKFLSCLVSPRSSHTLTLNPQTHIFLYAHWRLPLMHLLQIFTTVPCNLCVKRNQIRLVHSGSIFKFSVNFWQMLSVLYWTPCDLNLTQLLGGSVKICSVFLKPPCYLWLMPHTRKNNMVIIVSFKFYWRKKDVIKGKLFSTHVYILNILLVF